MGMPKGKPLVFHYEYSFAVSGGSTAAAIALIPKNDSALEAGLIITGFYVSVDTSFAGTATPTITMGNAGDPDGYSVDFYASGVAGTVFNAGKYAGALVWDDTNDVNVAYKIASAADAIPTITIATQALTAGKFQVYFTAIKPA